MRRQWPGGWFYYQVSHLCISRATRTLNDCREARDNCAWDTVGVYLKANNYTSTKQNFWIQFLLAHQDVPDSLLGFSQHCPEEVKIKVEKPDIRGSSPASRAGRIQFYQKHNSQVVCCDAEPSFQSDNSPLTGSWTAFIKQFSCQAESLE